MLLLGVLAGVGLAVREARRVGLDSGHGGFALLPPVCVRHHRRAAVLRYRVLAAISPAR